MPSGGDGKDSDAQKSTTVSHGTLAGLNERTLSSHPGTSAELRRDPRAPGA